MNEDLPFSTTIHVRDNCLCFQAQRAARVLARRFDEALKPAGLTNGQFSLLMSLNRPAPPTMSQVAATLGMDRTTLTAMLKPLARRGFARIEASECDKRSRIVVLTDAGRAVLVEALPAWRETHISIQQDMGMAGTETLRAGLASVASR